MQTQIVHESIEEYKRYNKVLEGNKSYVNKKLAQDEDYFRKLAKGQNPKYLLIGCSDSRAPPNEITETDPGEIFIHRNIANIVIPTDLNINCVIQYAIEHLKVHNIIVMGHTCCGGIKAAMKQDSVGGLLDLWLNQIKLVYEKHQELINSFTEEDDQINCLCCMNVREQVLNIWRNPIVQKSWQEGHPVMVHGWLFRVETGFIEELSLEDSIPEEMSKIFKIKFKPPKVQSPTQHEDEEGNAISPMRARRRFQRMQSRIETGIRHFTIHMQNVNEEEIEHKIVENIEQDLNV
ncbi:unnamed protein product [Paramecium octaurelia]|uniref:Carbonic anhydrase n=1 Tax=Paramecium octaurelia TaxID=43137 RepID=A0A8S1SH68_PAROT|nr:unnamed protein product [Paramecium octaurelia]